jgi:hypothetical protein
MIRIAIAAAALNAVTGTAFAGPPLICHSYSIGNDSSLPWGGDTRNWNNPDSKYDVRRLTTDTLKLLDSGKPLLTRMETLRRAAIYSLQDKGAGLELANTLIARALTAEVKGQHDSIALFDAGYFVESMKQLGPIAKTEFFTGIDGYDWTVRSVPGLQDKLTAEYALGLMQSRTAWPNEHIRRSVAGAQEGSLLAENLRKHFRDQNLSQIKRELASKTASR